ncbi:MAG TPA: folylpolyglutamate synthase/dihydrofolate synthase family protein [Verrucomicrobiae bacterium]|nr:folylpolyglutamate synthase/dihydrofolate synthase family protein [Verrucomicrobiae bacterium]
MTYAEAVQFLYDLNLFGAKFGLENTFKLASLAGNPQNRLRFIHVAGTNGKGSTCAMLESIYRAAGLRTGLFTSPHLVSLRERIQVNRRLISEGDVVRLVEELRRTGVAPVSEQKKETAQAEQKNGDRRDACPTFFEFVTVMALKFFAEQKCDLVIWETGLGGRLDATNIVTPLASVVTNIGIEHSEWLGDTFEKIAAEKAGIIKSAVPVITAARPGEGLEVIASVARGQRAPLTVVDESQVHCPLLDTVELPLHGAHQKLNAATAVATVRVLDRQFPVSDEILRRGLLKVDWPGRMQRVTTTSGQTVLLDGAHNPASAEALRAALQAEFPDAKPAVIFGVFKDKDSVSMCHSLAPLAGRLLLTPVHSDRTEDPARLVAACREANSLSPIEVCASLAQAVERAAGEPFVVITGSLYLVGEALELLGFSPANGGERALNEWTAKVSLR